MTHPTDIHQEWITLVEQHPICQQLEVAILVGKDWFGWERVACRLQTDGTSWAELVRAARRNGKIKVTWADGLSIDERRRLQERWIERWLIVEAIVCGMSAEFVKTATHAMMRKRGVVDVQDELRRMGQAIVDAHLCAAGVTP